MALLDQRLKLAGRLRPPALTLQLKRVPLGSLRPVSSVAMKCQLCGEQRAVI